MSRFGLHLRLPATLTALAHQAQQLNLRIFQSFLMVQATGKLIQIDPVDLAQFCKIRVDNFDQLYVHASYWINLSSALSSSVRLLLREMKIARQCLFNAIVVHPGSYKGFEKKMDGIDALARRLNRIIKQEGELELILENTAHGNFSIGSCIDDFALLLEKIDNPDRLFFCIDTAHAHAYGYALTNDKARDAFIAILVRTIGLEKIKLIHLNDTNEKLGSRIDRHLMPGAGQLGIDNLQAFANHPLLKNIPVIMELPATASDLEQRTIIARMENSQ